MCVNRVFNYTLTYISSFLSRNLKAVGEGRRYVAVVVWKVQSITRGMQMFVPTSREGLLGVTMACSQVTG